MTACRQCAKHEESDVIIKETLYEQRSIICQEQVRKTAKEQGNCISEEQVKEAFAELDLSNEQLQMVFDYLLKHKIGIGQPMDPDEFLTEEEKDYLQEYLDDYRPTVTVKNWHFPLRPWRERRMRSSA
mgnify:CR=1 FL=1